MKTLEEILKSGDLVIAKEHKISQRMFNITGKTCYKPGQISMVLIVKGPLLRSGADYYQIKLLSEEKIDFSNLGQETFLAVFKIIKL